MQFDVTLKQLFEQYTRGLQRQLTGATVVEWLNVELPRINLPRMDLLGRFDDGRLVNFEFMTRNEEGFEDRAGIYYIETHRKYGQYPRQIVLYFGREPMQIRNGIDSEEMRYRYQLIDVSQLDGDQLIEHGDLGDAMVAVLSSVRNRRGAIHHALDEIGKLEIGDRRVAWEQLLILAGLRGLVDEVKQEARFHMPFVIDPMELDFVREAYDSGRNAGKADGIVKGRAEAHAQILTSLLAKRFGTVPAWVSERIQAASTDELHRWLLQLSDAVTIHDLFRQ